RGEGLRESLREAPAAFSRRKKGIFRFMLTMLLVSLLVVFLSIQLSSISTTIYQHRTMAHKGLKLHPAVAALMKLQIWIFSGLSTREWVAVHRKHHHFTDQEGDPHSPLLKGLWNVLLLNAYYYSQESKNPEVLEKYTRDIPPSREEALFAYGPIGVSIGAAMFMTFFWLLFGGWAGPLAGLIVFIVQGVGYVSMNAVINGACHAVGYRNFNNTATNIRLVAWLSGGEGLHNNHHQYPSASKFSMRRGEFDPAWPVIRLLAALSLAEPLPLPESALSESR
ncbi:MAG: fatty acid desaturase, partial [Candidatus Korobacteraceae bacterium]